MVLPIIIGVGVTVAALSVKAGLGALKRYNALTPTMILALNGISISELNKHFNNIPNHELELKFAQFPGGFYQKMTESELLLILGISNEEILHLNKDLLKKKHRKCMLINHPDKGGSPYVAMKINQAKEVLEKSYMFKR